jgi:hypothetical protein
MAKRAASSESPPNLSQSTDGSDPDDDLIQFVGPMTVQDVGNAFLANRTLNGFPNTIIISVTNTLKTAVLLTQMNYFLVGDRGN